MMSTEFQIGSIVRSAAGRDSQALYAVKEILPNGYLLLTDGDKHPFEKPKKKNPKHLQRIADEPKFFEQFRQQKTVQNAQIRIILKGANHV